MRAYRREGPRIDVEAMCWELVDGREAATLAVDLSAGGLRVERPYLGGPSHREVPLQIEVPGVDEVMWARAETCFDRLVPDPSPAGGPLGLVRRTGYRIAAAARRDLRLLQEYVAEMHKRQLERSIEFALRRCYHRS